MSFPTIIGLEKAVEDQKDYLSLIEQDQTALGRLTDLYAEAQNVTDAEGESVLAQSFEAIAATTPTLRENWSMESAKDETIFQRIVRAIRTLIEAFMRNAKRLYEWINNTMMRTKLRRDALKSTLKDLKKALSESGTPRPVLVTPKQASLIFRDNRLPTDMLIAVTEVVTVINQFREGKSRKTVLELAKILTSGEAMKMSRRVFHQRFEILLKQRDITPRPSPWKTSTDKLEHVISLIGSATVWLNKPQGTELKQPYTYTITPDEVTPPKESVTVDITDKKVIEQLIDASLALLDELDKLSDSVADTRKPLKLAERVLSGINKGLEGISEGELDSVRNIVQNTDTLIKAMTVFPSQLYLHGMRVVSAQSVLLKAIIKKAK